MIQHSIRILTADEFAKRSKNLEKKKDHESGGKHYTIFIDKRNGRKYAVEM